MSQFNEKQAVTLSTDTEEHQECCIVRAEMAAISQDTQTS